MPRINGIATAFCDSEVAKPKLSPNQKGGCAGCIGVDPNKIPYGTHIKVYKKGTYDLLYEGIACDKCGAACKYDGYLVDVWFENNKKCNEWGKKEVTIDF